MAETNRAEAVDVLLRHCSRGDPRDAARLWSLATKAAAADNGTHTTEKPDLVDDVFRHIRRVEEGHCSRSPPPPPPLRFTIRAAELWAAEPALSPTTQVPFVRCAWGIASPPPESAGVDSCGFASALRRIMNEKLAAYATRYHIGAGLVAASAFVRPVETAVYEVIALVASAPAAASVPAQLSLFDDESSAEERFVRWTAAHVFELCVDTTREALALRHDGAFLVANVSGDGRGAHCAQRLCPVRRGRPEIISLPMLDASRVAAELCARVEAVDNALAPRVVAPVARATLPLLAARGTSGAAGESFGFRDSAVAAEAAAEAAAVASRRARSA